MGDTSIRPTIHLERPDWLTSDVWPFEPHAVELNGCHVHVTDVGTGPTLLFVHAGMWSFVWRDALLDLRRDHRCVAMDFPSSGLSDVDISPASIRTFSVVLEALVEKLGLDDLTLVFHDLGGPVAVAFAARRPELCRSLVAVNSFAWPARGALRSGLKLMGGPTMRRINTVTNVLPRMTSGRFGVGKHLDRPSRRAFVGPTRERARRHNFHDLMHDASRGDDVLGNIEDALSTTLAHLPLMTVFGQLNDPCRFRRRWRTHYPAASGLVVRRGGHFPMCDDPAAFARAIREWVASR